MRRDLRGYMRARFATRSVCLAGLVTVWLVNACSGGSGGFVGTPAGEQAGQSCSLSSQCYPV